MKKKDQRKPKYCECGEELVFEQEFLDERNIYTGKMEIIAGTMYLTCPKRFGFLGIINRKHAEYTKSNLSDMWVRSDI